MNLVQKEWEARIEPIRSIAKSEHAIARILDRVADVSDHSPDMAKLVRDNVASLTAMQLTMAEMITCSRMKRPQYKGWLQSIVYVPEGSSRTTARK